jgi:ABC-type transport system involved in Fe-S cluster assembly fused permease/ATPase subunit
MDDQPVNKSYNPKSDFSVWKAIIIGWLIVNIPAVLIILTTLTIGLKLEPKFWWLFLITGFVLGWAWWSYTIPRWRRWAHRKGAHPNKLQQVAVATGLTWAKGSVFEKTEAKIDE